MKNKVIHKFFGICYRVVLMPIAWVVNQKKLHSSYKQIAELRNSHEGERCFIIGNEPSLRAEDLSRIKEIPSFASNRIYEIYDLTDWRPTFYCIQDYEVIKKQYKNVNRKIDNTKCAKSLAKASTT